MGKEEIFRNALVEYLQTQLEGEQRKCGTYAEVVEAQKKASDEARKVLETMPKEGGRKVCRFYFCHSDRGLASYLSNGGQGYRGAIPGYWYDRLRKDKV